MLSHITNYLFVYKHNYGISGTLLTWLHNFFVGRSKRTNVGGTLCDFAVLLSRIIHGPIVLLIFINELADILAKLGIIVFDDDVKIYLKIVNDVDLRVHTVCH